MKREMGDYVQDVIEALLLSFIDDEELDDVEIERIKEADKIVKSKQFYTLISVN